MLDEIGLSSGIAQGLQVPVTSADRMRDTDHRIYLLTNPSGAGWVCIKINFTYLLGCFILCGLNKRCVGHFREDWFSINSIKIKHSVLLVSKLNSKLIVSLLESPSQMFTGLDAAAVNFSAWSQTAKSVFVPFKAGESRCRFHTRRFHIRRLSLLDFCFIYFSGKGTLVGLLKIGRKKLYIFDKPGKHHELTPICVLDFYVHESMQRNGCGRILYEHMLHVRWKKCWFLSPIRS